MPYFAPFLLILFLIAAVLRVDFFFTIVYLLFAVYLLSRLWMRRVTDQLDAYRRFTAHAFHGDQVTVDLVVRNTGWLPVPWLELHESLPVELTAPPFHREAVSLGAGERRSFRYTLNCRKRGYYPIGPLEMQTGDLLGVTSPSQVKIAPGHVIVYPRMVPLQQLGLPTRSPSVVLPARTPLFEDPTRVMGVRDYRRGDSPRRIHWSATAHAGQLLVKQYQPAIARETLICLDLDRGDYGQRQRYTATELAIVTAASIANHIIVEEELPVGLATEAWDSVSGDRARFSLPPRSERAHLMNVLEVLARVDILPETTFTDLLRRESVDLPWGATLVVITGRESEELLDTLVYLRRAGFLIALVLVQPAQSSAELRGRTEALRSSDLLDVSVHRVWQERDLEGWR